MQFINCQLVGFRRFLCMRECFTRTLQYKMFTNGTQKRNWIFESPEQLTKLRQKANKKFRSKYDAVVTEELSECFLSVSEEVELCSLVSETGQRFGDSFDPSLPQSLVWMAFSYYKRFYLRQSAMEYAPKSVMMACFYLACKIDEFYVSIDQFVSNLKSGTPQSNSENVLGLEPLVLSKLDYQLVVHCPHRPLEGHLIELKTRFPDPWATRAESLRPEAQAFLRKAAISDAPLLYSPSQLALAALEYAARQQNSNLDEFVIWLCNDKAVRISERLGHIIATVSDVQSCNPQRSQALQKRMAQWCNAQMILDKKIG